MWKGCSTTARTCDSARSTGSANSRSAFGSALMMLRLIAMFHDTSRYSSSGRLSAPVYPASPKTSSSSPCSSAAVWVMSASLAAVPLAVCTSPEATSTPMWAFIPKYHVWMPPFAQEGFERFDHVIGCGHVSGLQVRPDMAAGRYGDTRTWRKSLIRALSSLALVAFPGPDLTDHLILPFIDLLTRPTFPKLRRPRLTQIAATAGTRKSSPFASMAQTERAILLASAIATSIFGLRASMRCSQLLSGAPFRKAERM